MKRRKANDKMPAAAMAGLCGSLLVVVVGLMAINPLIIGAGGFCAYVTGKVVKTWVVS